MAIWGTMIFTATKAMIFYMEEKDMTPFTGAKAMMMLPADQEMII